MLTYLRYPLAKACFALSVGCLAFRRQSTRGYEFYAGTRLANGPHYCGLQTHDGYLMVISMSLSSNSISASTSTYGRTTRSKDSRLQSFIEERGDVCEGGW